jgi:hypothetical protein
LREAMLGLDEPVGRWLAQALTSIVAEARSTIGPRMTQGYSRPNHPGRARHQTVRTGGPARRSHHLTPDAAPGNPGVWRCFPPRSISCRTSRLTGFLSTGRVMHQ